jgi:hypothetical protein
MCTDFSGGGSEVLRVVIQNQPLTERVFPTRVGLRRRQSVKSTSRGRVPHARGAEAMPGR